jgi:hypothetical protein
LTRRPGSPAVWRNRLPARRTASDSRDRKDFLIGMTRRCRRGSASAIAPAGAVGRGRRGSRIPEGGQSPPGPRRLPMAQRPGAVKDFTTVLSGRTHGHALSERCLLRGSRDSQGSGRVEVAELLRGEPVARVVPARDVEAEREYGDRGGTRVIDVEVARAYALHDDSTD